MNRAEAMAAASVTRTISSARSFSITTPEAPSGAPSARRTRGRERAHSDVRERAPAGSNAAIGTHGGASMAEVALAGEDHRQMVAIGDLDGHLVADRAT